MVMEGSAADVASIGEDMKEAGEARRRLKELSDQLERLQHASAEERDEVVRRALAGARAATRRRIWPLVERIALSLAVAGGVGGLFEYWNNHQKERREAAQTTYREVWGKYADFMTDCMEHPKLDCHTIPVDQESLDAFTAEDWRQQTRLDTILIDTLEFAFKQYEDPDFKAAAGHAYADEWPGWEVYVKKHLVRDHFRRTWCTIRDEYATAFVPWMDRWMSEVGKSCSADTPAKAE